MKHKEAEQRRRAAIRGLQEQISVFFLVKGKKKITVGNLLLFGKSTNLTSKLMACLPIVLVIIYLKIGKVAFPGLVRPRSPGHRE